MYIKATENGKVFKGKVVIIQVSMRGGISLGLAIGVSVGVILLIVLIFIILFICWKRKYPAYTLIERSEDGTGKKCYIFWSTMPGVNKFDWRQCTEGYKSLPRKLIPPCIVGTPLI